MRRIKRIKSIKCNNCGYSSHPRRFIKRTNYPFGRKSKGLTVIICPRCKNIVEKKDDKREY